MNILKQFEGEINHSGKILLYDMFAGIGDVLWRTSLFKELKRRNPEIKLYVSSMGNYWKPMLQNNSDVDKLVDRIGNPPYIDGIDYYVSDRACPHVISQYSREMDALDALEKWAGFEIRDKSFVYQITEDENKWANEFLGKYKRHIIGIQLKSSTWVRTWPVEETIKLIRILRNNGINIVVMDNGQFGFKDDGIINLTGYNIREVAAIIKNVDLMVTPDSGLMHFAGHFRVPTIVIFGGSDYSCRVKYFPTVTPISKGNISCEQWPCWSHSYMCNKGIPAPCMSAIKAEEIFDMVRQIL